MSTQNGAGSLYAKLAKVMEEVHRIPKNGQNKFQNYAYATESDAADFIRPLLAKHGIGLIVGVEEVERQENGITLARLAITMGDESGATITTHSYGEARDVDSKGNRQDKGLYKAITGAVKYWLFKTFLISTGDDPETDAGNGPETRNRTITDPKVADSLRGATKALDDALVAALVERRIEAGIGKDEAANLYRALTARAGTNGNGSEPKGAGAGDTPLDKLNRRYFAILKAKGITGDKDRRALQERIAGKTSCTAFTADDYEACIAELDQMEDAPADMFAGEEA